MPTPFGTIYTSNITPDQDSGIGKWSSDDFWATMHDGRSRNGGLLYPAMPFGSYTKVTRADSDAIFAYLRAFPAVRQPNRANELQFPSSKATSAARWNPTDR